MSERPCDRIRRDILQGGELLTRRKGAAAEHQAILDAVLDHDTARACALLAEHDRITLEGLRQVIPSDSEESILVVGPCPGLRP